MEIEAETVKISREIEVYVLMHRYGPDYWFPTGQMVTDGKPKAPLNLPDTITAWRWVKVSGLPIEVPDWEV